MKSPRQGGPGFTVLEAVVALAIASVTVGALAREITAAVRTREAAERLDAASLLAGRSLEQLLARDAGSLGPEDSSDEVPHPGGVLRRRRTVEVGPRENLWQLAVEVTAPGTAPVVFRTLLRKPWS